jgi:hypothetical protein
MKMIAQNLALVREIFLDYINAFSWSWFFDEPFFFFNFQFASTTISNSFAIYEFF